MIQKSLTRLLNSNYSNLIGLLIIFVVLSLTSPAFLTATNITNLIKQIAVVGVLAVGMTLVILIKEIDLSVARIAALCGVLAAWLQVLQGQNTFITITLVILAGALMGLWNGVLIAFFKIPSFIITLGTMSIANGLAFLLTGSKSIGPMYPGFAAIGKNHIPAIVTGILMTVAVAGYLLGLFYQNQKRRQKSLPSNLNADTCIKVAVVVVISAFFACMLMMDEGMPYSVAILLVIALLAGFVLNKTPFGRHLYAIGGNEKAAHLSGINVKLHRLVVFVIMGALAAVAGIILTARLDTAMPSMAQMYELDAIAAVVIGGTSLSGGRGTIGGSIIGIFIIGMLNNGMTLQGIDIYWQWIFKGLIIIGAVLLDRRNKQ